VVPSARVWDRDFDRPDLVTAGITTNTLSVQAIWQRHDLPDCLCKTLKRRGSLNTGYRCLAAEDHEVTRSRLAGLQGC